MRPVPQAKDWLPCQPLGSFIGKAALTLCYCWTGPDQASRSCSQAKNLMACFTQHWATAICKSWQQKSSHFTAVLHSQKLAEFGPLLSTPDLFKQMSHDQELKQNLDSCEQYSSHVIIIIFLSGTSEVLMYSRKTESRKAASVCTHPHRGSYSASRTCSSANSPKHPQPAQERGLCSRTGHRELSCTLHSKGMGQLISRAKGSNDCSDLQGMIALYRIALFIYLQ